MNKLNNVLKYRESNNLGISQEEKNMIETIKKVSSNRVQYRNTHQMLKEDKEKEKESKNKNENQKK